MVSAKYYALVYRCRGTREKEIHREKLGALPDTGVLVPLRLRNEISEVNRVVL